MVDILCHSAKFIKTPPVQLHQRCFFVERTTVVRPVRYIAGIKIRKGAFFMETVLAILYSIVGYWAVNCTIYAHYVMVGDIGSIILRKWMVGLIAGPICIPWAIIKLVMANKND